MSNLFFTPSAIPAGQYLASDGKYYPIAPAPVAPAAYAPPPPAAPAYAPPPQGFTGQAFPASSLNGVQVRGEALFPQTQGVYGLQLVGFAKKTGDLSGPAYWPRVRVLASTAPEVPVGSEFAFLCKVALTPKQNSGDQRRKAILAAAHGQSPSAAIDWDALSASTETRNLEAQPLYLQARMRTSNRPMLDQKTKQPTGQFWVDETFLRWAPPAV
jgi:hypothetical protein